MATSVFTNATLIDGTGADSRPNTSVIVEDTAIARIVPDDALTLPSGAGVIDCAGRTLMPGLTDAHTHLGIVAEARANPPPAIHALRIARNIEETLDAGFTTVRDAGGIDGAWAHAIRSGMLRGPRILPSGATLSQTGGHGDGRTRFSDEPARGIPGLFHFSELCDSPASVRKAAREQLRRGATQIKVMASGGAMSPTDELEHSQFTIEELAAAVYEAESAGTYVLAHAYAPRAIGNALAAGVRSIEHGNLLDEATAAAMKQAGAWLVPTLITYDMIDKHGPAQGVPDNMLRKIRQAKEGGEEAVRIAMAVGLQICSGSDLLGSMQPHKTTELTLKASIMGNMAALVSATAVNSKLFRLDSRIGIVAEGMQGDLMVVDGNPIDDITVLESPQNVRLVMKDGVILKRLAD